LVLLVAVLVPQLLVVVQVSCDKEQTAVMVTVQTQGTFLAVVAVVLEPLGKMHLPL
jgi:hypothetical protein